MANEANVMSFLTDFTLENRTKLLKLLNLLKFMQFPPIFYVHAVSAVRRFRGYTSMKGCTYFLPFPGSFVV